MNNQEFGTSQQRTDVEPSCNDLMNTQDFGTSQQRTDLETSCNDLVNDREGDHSESQGGQIHPKAGQTFWSTPIGPTDVRKLDIIRFKRSADEEWTTGEILSRAGKGSGKFSNLWNIKNIQSGHQKPKNVKQFAIIEKITMEENPVQTDKIATYAVNIPF